MDYKDKIVLVVEDDDMLRQILVQQFSASFNVVAAADGEQALQFIQKYRPDAIVLDLLLPRVDGFQVLRELRAMPDRALSQTPVLVVSNLADSQSIELTNNYNVVAYYTKAEVGMGTITNRINRLFSEQGAV